MIYVAVGTRLRNPNALHDCGAVYSYTVPCFWLLVQHAAAKKGVCTHPTNPLVTGL